MVNSLLCILWDYYDYHPPPSSLSLSQMENISHFLSFCERFGMKRSDLFQTVDLYEGQNIPQVRQ